MALTEEQFRLRQQLAVNSRWAQTSAEDREANGQRGQRGLRDRLARDIDPDGTMDPAELEKRTTNAVTAHFQRLALASSRARSARKTESS